MIKSGRYPHKTLLDVYEILDKLKPDEYGCINWLGKSCNYGSRVKIFNVGHIYVSRIVLERKIGRQIRPGYCALHTCDWRSCVNPEHLYEGTLQDNVKDMVKRSPEAVWKQPRSQTQINALIEYARSPENLERLVQLRKERWARYRQRQTND